MEESEAPIGYAVPALAAVHVDPGDLTSVARHLRAELEQNLRPQTAEISHDFLQGVGFGDGSASEPLRASRDQYASCLTSAMTALDFYVDSTQALAAAVEQAAAMYRGSDAQAVGTTANTTYNDSLATIRNQRHVEDIRDAHISVNP